MPAECDVSIRKGWFWHKTERPKSAITLLDLYYKSVGRNCLFLLNVPPNSSGLISEEDIQVLQEFSELRSSIFSDNLAKNADVFASSTRGGAVSAHFNSDNVLQEGLNYYWAPEEGNSYWALYLELEKLVSFNVLLLQEPIQMGQRISEFHLDIFTEGKWKQAANGTTVGYKRLLKFEKVESQSLRLVIDKSRSDPLVSYLGIYFDPFTIVEKQLCTMSRPCPVVEEGKYHGWS